MNIMLMLLVVPLITAFLTMAVLKYQKTVWTIFLAVSGYLSYALFTMYGNWDLSWSMELGFKMFGKNIELGLINSPLGWFFAFFASLTTLLIAMFSIAYNDEKHDSKTAPIWLLLIFSNIGILFAKD